MKSLLTHTGLLIVALGGAPTTFAADEETRLERVIVTASRAEEWATRRAASVTVIDREELDLQNARDLADVLRFNAGLDIGRNGGPGQTTSVFIRGAESNHTLLLVDGVRINPGTIGVPALQNIDPDLIERVEIVKGPRSTIYGSDAIGGVINVITRRGTSPKDVNITVGGGSFGTTDVSAQAGVGDSDFGANFGVSHYDTDGFATREGATDDHGYDNLSFNASLWGTRDNHRFEFDAWRSDGNTEYADFSLNTVDQDYTNQSLKARLVSQLLPFWESAVTVAHITDDIQQNQPSFTGEKDFLTTERVSFDWQNTLMDRNQNRLVMGVYGFDESVEVLSFGSPFNEDTSVIAAYSEYGIRGERYDASIAARFTDHDDFGSATTWHLDVGYRINPQLQLILAAGSGFRAPDATDRFGFGGNQDLDAEESVTLELGARYRFSDRQMLSVRLFDQNIDNLINFVVTDFTTFAGSNQNIDETRTSGVEIGHQWAGNRLRIETSLILQDPKDEVTDLALLRRAEETLTTNAYYTIGNGTVGLNVLATGKRADIDGNTFMRIESPGYVLGNLSYSHRVNNQWTVRASIDNVLDSDYQTADGFNTAERSFYLEFNYALPLFR
ncbi:MAG: TonB-dependent receptor [Gammaproteobacteria bacterium]